MTTKNTTTTTPGGVGFLGLLTILFIGLKLTGHIAWSWLWVLSPIFLPLAFLIAMGVLCLIVYLAVLAAASISKKSK